MPPKSAPPLLKAVAPPGSRSYPAFREAFLKKDCRACALERGRTNLVLDRGNPLARVLVIGEAPGAEEDLAGRSFVGRSGKLLDRIMASVGLDTERDMLITNVVKCRPPANRPPRDEEARACAPYLDTQIGLVRPLLLVTLGATAFRRMVPGQEFSACVGKILDLPERGKLLALFHPAYLLYDPRKRDLMREHVRGLRSFLEENALIEPDRPLGPAF